MGCRLTQNIKHTCDYNPGGIKEVLLLDIQDFHSYQFRDDGLHDSCFVERINKEVVPFLELGVVSESHFAETSASGVYKQELKTFVRSLNASNTSRLMQASANRYLIVFTTYQDKLYSFGADGGASLSFTQVTGQMGETSGYEITLSKNSTLPLFEVDGKALLDRLLSTEDNRLVLTDDNRFINV